MRAARLLLVLAAVAALGITTFAALEPGPVPATNTVPPRTADPSTRILVIGDNHGDTAVYRRILRDVKTRNYDLAVNLADTSENGTAEEFAEVRALEASLPFPVLHVVGSHDIAHDPTRATFERAFNPRHLSRDIGPAHLVLLDNADRTIGFAPTELDWLEQDLATTTQPVTLVFFHRPFGLPFATLTGDDETAASRKTNDRFLRILAAHPVAHVYAAHLHAYLPYSLALPSPTPTGERYVPVTVSGGGGKPAQAVLGGPTKSFFHSLELTVTPSGVTERVIPAPPA